MTNQRVITRAQVITTEEVIKIYNTKLEKEGAAAEQGKQGKQREKKCNRPRVEMNQKYLLLLVNQLRYLLNSHFEKALLNTYRNKLQSFKPQKQIPVQS